MQVRGRPEAGRRQAVARLQGAQGRVSSTRGQGPVGPAGGKTAETQVPEGSLVRGGGLWQGGGGIGLEKVKGEWGGGGKEATKKGVLFGFWGGDSKDRGIGITVS